MKKLPRLSVLALVHLLWICPASLQADPLDEWTWRNPLPQGDSLSAVTYGNNQFVAVGYSGRILTSPDGSAWTNRISAAPTELLGIAFGNNHHCRNLAIRPRAFRFRAGVFLQVLMVGLGWLLAGRVTAQTFTTLRSFAPNDLEGYPWGLILSGNTMYGTALETAFTIKTDGTEFTTLHRFDYPDGSPPGRMILSGTTLYGTTGGADSSGGTVFKINTDGTGFTNLYSFTASRSNSLGVETNSDGVGSNGLILSGDTLYGTSVDGGSSGNGTVFALNTDGTGFRNLHSFTATSDNSGCAANSDGANPSGLILAGNTLYGTAYGGTSGSGTVFKVNTDGTGFTNLHSFTAASFISGGWASNSEGVGPNGLILSGNTLYGTAWYGGTSGSGTVFALNTDGTGFTNLYSFPALILYYSNSFGAVYTNSNGAVPLGGLILSGTILYGTANVGGSSGNGTVFAINTDGTGITTLYRFTENSITSDWVINSDGANPGGLILSGNTLFGTAGYGGSGGEGTVFSLSFPPQLTIVASGGNVVSTWPTNYAGFDYSGYRLQSTTNLLSPAWTTNSAAPFVVNGKNTVTNPISGTQQFFRLSQ